MYRVFKCYENFIHCDCLQQNIAKKLQDMWPESSSVNTVDTVTKFTTIPEISNFSPGDYFLQAATSLRSVTACLWRHSSSSLGYSFRHAAAAALTFFSFFLFLFSSFNLFVYFFSFLYLFCFYFNGIFYFCLQLDWNKNSTVTLVSPSTFTVTIKIQFSMICKAFITQTVAPGLQYLQFRRNFTQHQLMWLALSALQQLQTQVLTSFTWSFGQFSSVFCPKFWIFVEVSLEVFHPLR